MQKSENLMNKEARDKLAIDLKKTKAKILSCEKKIETQEKNFEQELELFRLQGEKVEAAKKLEETNLPKQLHELNEKTPLWKKLVFALVVLSMVIIALVVAISPTKRTSCLRNCGEDSECEYSDEYDQYVCVCKDGYTGNHISGCEDINECENQSHGCGRHAKKRFEMTIICSMMFTSIS